MSTATGTVYIELSSGVPILYPFVEKNWHLSISIRNDTILYIDSIEKIVHKIQRLNG